MFAQPFSGLMPPAGTYNPGYGAPPSGGSMSRYGDYQFKLQFLMAASICVVHVLLSPIGRFAASREA